MNTGYVPLSLDELLVAVNDDLLNCNFSEMSDDELGFIYSKLKCLENTRELLSDLIKDRAVTAQQFDSRYLKISKVSQVVRWKKLYSSNSELLFKSVLEKLNSNTARTRNYTVYDVATPKSFLGVVKDLALLEEELKEFGDEGEPVLRITVKQDVA